MAGLVGFDPAFARSQQLLQLLAVGFLGLLIAMPLVVELQASPLIGIDGVGLRSFKFAVGRRRFVDWCVGGFIDWFVSDERPVRSVGLSSGPGMDDRGTVGR
ncbi:MAG: hypothetical protein WCD69_27115 [Xanthobacteraceae bacterium]